MAPDLIRPLGTALVAAFLLFPGLPALAQGGAEAAAAVPARPNIVLFLVDDMGWRDWSGAAGGGDAGSRYYRTPAIDALAARGMRFDQAYAGAAVCSPSRAALLSGVSPARLHLTDWIPGEGTPAGSRFRVPDWTMRLPAETTTIAEALRPLGYRSACIGKWHLGGARSRPEDHGFDLAIAAGSIGHPASHLWPYGAAGHSHRVPDLAERGGAEGEYLADRLTDEALTFMRDCRKEEARRPFFLYLSHYAVHSPLEAAAADREAVADWKPDGGQSHPVYAAMIRAVDRSVARISAELDALGIAGETVVVFSSDNGGVVHSRPPATSNAPLRLGKGYPYEGGLRVPLVIVAPGRAMPGSANTEAVIGTDLHDTLIELAGAPVAAGSDGRSLVPALSGRASPSRGLLWHYPHYWNGRVVTPFSVWREGSLKLIRFHETGSQELYDLAADPGETEDLASRRPEDLARLTAGMDRALNEQSAQMPLPRDR